MISAISSSIGTYGSTEKDEGDGLEVDIENYGCISAAERRFGFGFCASTQGCNLTPITMPKEIPNINARIAYRYKVGWSTRYILVPQTK